MTATSFAPTLSFTLVEEGGYVVDSGGETENGVTLTYWREWTHNPTANAASLRAMTPAQRTALYHTIWADGAGDALPPGVDASVFDAHVNSGTQAAMQLQRVVGLAGTQCDGAIGPGTLAAVARVDGGTAALRLRPGLTGGVAAFQAGLGWTPDGVFGPQTRAAAAAHPSGVIVALLFDQQVTFYRACRDFPTYGAGWLGRAKRRVALGMRLATGRGVLQAPIS